MRLRKPHAPVYPTGSNGGLDPFLWKGTFEIVMAATIADPFPFTKSYNDFGTNLTFAAQRLFGLYAIYILKYRLGTLAGRVPQEDDLRTLARRAYPQYNVLLKGTLLDVENTLLTAFHLASDRDEVKGGIFTFRACALTGALLDDPVADLLAMRQPLAAWCLKQIDSIRAVCEMPSAST